MYITDTATKRFFQERLEPIRSRPELLAGARRKHILERLTAAETLERYLHTKYVGQKRFSGEGGDTMIPMLDQLIEKAGAAGVGEIVMGMAHRGRLNVLVNILGKMPANLFSRVRRQGGAGAARGRREVPPGLLVGRVDARRPGAPDARVQSVAPRDRQSGRRRLGARAPAPARRHARRPGAADPDPRRRRDRGPGREPGMPQHGRRRAAITPAARSTSSSTTRSASPRPIRATRAARTFCTDIAKMVEAPILHVNGDDPEVALLAIEIALDYRQRFHKDVFIDLVCFRRLGHNEADEPMVTQPLMYKRIAQHPGTRKLYADQLVARRRDHGRRGGRDGRRVPRRDGPRPAHEQDGAVQLQAAVHDRLGALRGPPLGRHRRHPRAARRR